MSNRRTAGSTALMPPRRRFAEALLAAVSAVVTLAACGPPAKPAAEPRPEHSPHPIRFESVAATVGLNHRWPTLPQPLTILDAFGCGCAFLDYDGDDWQDVLLVSEPHPRLYRNLAGRRFVDVTSGSGLERLKGAWKGCAVGDYDGDGRRDLLLTGFRCLALLRNAGGGVFRDSTKQAGLAAGDRWSASAGFMDLNGDEALDLVLLNYVRFGPKERQYCEPKTGIQAGCPPRYYLPQLPEVWQNAAGRFRNVSDAAGMQSATGTAQVLAFVDVEEDGDLDFYVGNDGTPADLMTNQGKLRFKNTGLEAGVAYGSDGSAIAAMSADFADYDRDGRFDLFVTAFSGESSALLRAVGGGSYQHAAQSVGLEDATRTSLGFGSRWVDMDNDGWCDLAVANGHVYDRASEIYPGTAFKQPIMLFQNVSGNSFRDVAPLLGGDLTTPILGRGLATGDYDNDGRVDVLVVDHSGGPLLLRNTSDPKQHWITLDLRGRGANRFAYGARIKARSGKERWIGQVSPCAGYLSSSDPRIHLGLGAVARLDVLSIRWPSGRTAELRDVPVDQIIRITESNEDSFTQVRAPREQVP